MSLPTCNDVGNQEIETIRPSLSITLVKDGFRQRADAFVRLLHIIAGITQIARIVRRYGRMCSTLFEMMPRHSALSIQVST